MLGVGLGELLFLQFSVELDQLRTGVNLAVAEKPKVFFSSLSLFPFEADSFCMTVTRSAGRLFRRVPTCGALICPLMDFVG